MTLSIDPGLIHIYETWHATVRVRDLTATAALYGEDAVFETPLVLAVYPDHGSGILIGRATIQRFMEDSVRRFPSDLAEWYRSDKAFINGRQLTWEYPRKTPKGEQIDLMEMMEIDNGLITCHRVYWGWYGIRLLLPALAKAQAL
ncbi:nuclear transport factor 2 family protein [Pseudomonas sp. FP597]|uniref:Nuclear transport factor 2 family protein n=1 Tax=Pseudomonas lactucae TaxID=2813360 RepID=A0A9X1C576_9PSED|nr:MULTISPECIES: nuclear transport factor 2 family protein [Pseudomonas]MBN2975755.1 nuclear transport factor 2 family protein [Pseudomonas lactucae]MBN2985918.1 nuclear transport factor 2 family protein [Pseudomonas lactucae]WLI08874.1 nuclear transport factor 2 family protein [Pseudomonas sp. FP597]